MSLSHFEPFWIFEMSLRWVWAILSLRWVLVLPWKHMEVSLGSFQLVSNCSRKVWWHSTNPADSNLLQPCTLVGRRLRRQQSAVCGLVRCLVVDVVAALRSVRATRPMLALHPSTDTFDSSSVELWVLAGADLLIGWLRIYFCFINRCKTAAWASEIN